jgi:hypothetical protein
VLNREGKQIVAASFLNVGLDKIELIVPASESTMS